MFYVNVVDDQTDFDKLTRQINESVWDEANDMTLYDSDSLKSYVQQSDTVFITCHTSDDSDAALMGFASAQFLLKPYHRERWLYVDELDVCVDQRQLGAGKALMKCLLDLAEDKKCVEVWLGTEIDNIPANALYKSLEPDEIEQFIGYTYEFDE